jgi:hypothetical protein
MNRAGRSRGGPGPASKLEPAGPERAALPGRGMGGSEAPRPQAENGVPCPRRPASGTPSASAGQRPGPVPRTPQREGPLGNPAGHPFRHSALLAPPNPHFLFLGSPTSPRSPFSGPAWPPGLPERSPQCAWPVSVHPAHPSLLQTPRLEPILRMGSRRPSVPHPPRRPTLCSAGPGLP